MPDPHSTHTQLSKAPSYTSHHGSEVDQTEKMF